MAKRNLKAFMRDSAKVEEIITVPGPEGMIEESGEQLMLEIKVLSADAINVINDKYTKRTMAVDKKGNPYIQGGEVAFKTEIDYEKANGHLLAEALIYPDLKDSELMKFFDCHDISKMARKVFPKADEWAHINNAVKAALGLGREPDNGEIEDAVDEAKN